MKDYLFVYGTLLDGAAPAAMEAVCRRLRRCGPAVVFGTLYDLGSYPGIVLEGDKLVSGEVVGVSSASMWLRLDTYEGFDRANPERSLYRRERTRATLADGEAVDCWVYVYNRDLGDAAMIDCGCWRTHLFDGDVTTVPV